MAVRATIFDNDVLLMMLTMIRAKYGLGKFHSAAAGQ